MQFRTDMADERRDLYRKANKLEEEVAGIECEEEERYGNKITRVKVLNEEGEKALNKKKGNYITIDLKKVSNLEDGERERVEDVIAEEISALTEKYLVSPEDEALVVGLGNNDLVCDSLGSKVIEKIEVTRHIKKYYPQFLKEGARGISSFATSVMGKTGIETLEIVQGVSDKIKPKLIIAIDSLASRSIERVNKSIQISDTGIIPGGGVGNERMGITYETLGIPVIAIGVPTAVETAVIVNDALNLFIEKLQDKAQSNDYLNKLKETDNYDDIKEALNPYDYNLVVTPKEIDELTVDLAGLISNAINFAL
ncbi:MAG: GPR endopeptidase [Clostridia bacterium]|nr:GPR endopeptidase [Clostridia bacterium]